MVEAEEKTRFSRRSQGRAPRLRRRGWANESFHSGRDAAVQVFGHGFDPLDQRSDRLGQFRVLLELSWTPDLGPLAKV